MKSWYTSIVSILIILGATAIAKEPVLPRQDLKEDWVTLEKKNYAKWEIDEFVMWSGCADGGSMAFIFKTVERIEFCVLVTNQFHYWTQEDIEKKRQVIYLSESGRYYLLKPGSEQERVLLKMLQQIEKGLKEEGETSKPRITALREIIKSRKPMGAYWPLTQKEIDQIIIEKELRDKEPPSDPFESPID